MRIVCLSDTHTLLAHVDVPDGDVLDWAFNLERGEETATKWALLGHFDVLLTHGPPHRILDETSRGEFVGCEELGRPLQRVHPRLHVFGHIHQSYGAHEAA